jgi:hypothetical protein
VAALCLRAALRRSWYRDRILVRLWDELQVWLNRVASSHCLSDDIRRHSHRACIRSPRVASVPLQTWPQRRSDANHVRRVYDGTPDTPKIAKENADILEALKIEQENGEYRWSQLMKRDEVQTGRRVLLAYGMQVSNSFLSPNSRSISIGDVSDPLLLVYEPNGRHQSGRLLYHVGLTTQCWTRSKSVIIAWGRYQPDVLCRVSVSNILPRQVWPT